VWFSHGHALGFDQIRVPLLWRSAAPRESVVITEPVSLVDLAPTLLEIAGLDAPPRFVGRPLPRGSDEQPRQERALYAEHPKQAVVIRGRTYYWGARDPSQQAPVARLLSLPRGATLPATGEAPGYVPAQTGAEWSSLAAALADFTRMPEENRGAVHDVPQDVRDEMRALGYAE
jgi:hypothetical protein